MQTRFNKSNCINCLCDFKSNSDICVSNEWNHIFHYFCYKIWFFNIPINRDLPCPICNTAITDTSKIPNNDSEYKSDEISASIEYNTPGHMLDQNQNMLTNYVNFIWTLENNISKSSARVTSQECLASDHYEDIEQISE